VFGLEIVDLNVFFSNFIHSNGFVLNGNDNIIAASFPSASIIRKFTRLFGGKTVFHRTHFTMLVCKLSRTISLMQFDGNVCFNALLHPRHWLGEYENK
jgi:hypothetical protein